jgi:hypothetical protein
MKRSASAAAAGLCLIGAAVLWASRTSPAAGQDAQAERPKVYGARILDHINVVDPDNALGEADGRFAEIRPGGELTVLMAERLYYSDASDDGTVVTKEGGRYGVAGLFQMTEEGPPAWQPLAPGRTPGGFKFGTSMFSVVQSTDTLKIANDDTRSVFVDAVIGYGKDKRTR